MAGILAVALTVEVSAAADPLEEGEMALAGGLPSVALARLANLPAESGDRGERRAIALGRALLAIDDPRSAAEVLGPLSEDAGAPRRFWLAEALAALGSHNEALDLYSLAAGDPDLGADAAVGAARMKAALGRTDEAIADLTSVQSPRAVLDLSALKIDKGDVAGALRDLEAEVPPPLSAERSYLIARTALLAGDHEAALASLEKIRKPGPELAVRSTILKARCLDLTSRDEDAEKLLEAFIEGHPRHPMLIEVFEALDKLHAGQSSPSSTDLRLWSEDTQHPARASLATFFLGLNEQRLERVERSTQAFLSFLEASPEGPMADRARATAARNLLDAGNPSEAILLLESAAGPLSTFVRGLACAQAGEFAAAAAAFSEAGRTTGWEAASRNAAICSVLAGDHGGPSGTTPSEALRLAECMVMASKRDPSAPELLNNLAESTGAHAAAARLALAEWYYLEKNPAEAGRQLSRISNADASTEERAAVLEAFLSDDGTSVGSERALEAALGFRRKFPQSPLLGETSLKAGEILFRRGDYIAARGQFEAAASAQAGSPVAEAASFMAAEAAARSMDPAAREEALEMYEDLARADGPLALRARLAQAFLLNALGKPLEALSVLDKILDSSPDGEMRFAAIIEKGDTLFASVPKDPSAAREAIAVWRLAAEAGTPARWRNQALAKIGAASEKLGEIPAALTSYYDAISSPQQDEPEFFWFYKAGFDAARLLESQERLNEAIEIYEKLASKDGPRSGEARQRLTRLRLENFLWED